MKPTRLKFCKTKTELAHALGIARTTLNRWIATPDFPEHGTRGWDLVACKVFAENSALDKLPALAEEKRRLLSAQADFAEMKLKREAEVLVLKEDVKQSLAAIIGAWTGVLKRTISKEDYNACTRQFQKINYRV